jgi:hypothetical protein
VPTFLGLFQFLLYPLLSLLCFLAYPLRLVESVCCGWRNSKSNTERGGLSASSSVFAEDADLRKLFWLLTAMVVYDICVIY